MEYLVPSSFHFTVDHTLRTFKCVLIPSDDSKSLEEISIPQAPDRSLSAMLDYSNAHFSRFQLSEQQRLEYGNSVLKDHKQGLSQEHIDRLTNMTLSEVVPLQSHSKKTSFIAVNLVVDDKAVAKNLPFNARASSIAVQCGGAVQVKGDAFLCRQFDNEEGFYRLDFSLRDLNEYDSITDADSTALDPLWIPFAKAVKLDDKPGQERVIKLLKDRGNEYFKLKCFANACVYYSRALGLLDNSLPFRSNPALLELKTQLMANESACKLKLGDAKGALTMADQVVSLRPKWTKAWFRKAEALTVLGRMQEAQDAWTKSGITPPLAAEPLSTSQPGESGPHSEKTSQESI